MTPHILHTDKPVREVVTTILEVAADVSKPSQSQELWEMFRVDLFTPIAAGFQAKSEGSNDELGNSWQPLSAARIEEKANKLRNLPAPRGNVHTSDTRPEAWMIAILSRRILIDTGNLRQSINDLASPRQPSKFSSARYTNTKAIYSVDLPYAQFQSTKQTYQWNGVTVTKPARPIWPSKLGRWFDNAVDRLGDRIANAIAFSVADKFLFVIPPQAQH